MRDPSRAKMVGTKVGTRDKEVTRTVGRMATKAEAPVGTGRALSGRTMVDTNPRLFKGRIIGRRITSSKALGLDARLIGRQQGQRQRSDEWGAIPLSCQW
jgi:hypothetical protein